MKWEGQPRQNKFLKELLDPNGADEILFGGAAGGGKTDTLIIGGIIYAQQGGYVLYLRRTFPQLEGKPIPRSKELIPQSVASYNEQKKQWTFKKSGGVFKFGHLQHLNNIYDYQGHEYDLIIFDELTQFLEQQYMYLLSRNRTTKKLKPKMISASNPGGIGHVFVKKRFQIGVTDPETIFETKQTEEEIRLGVEPRKRIFIPSKLTDNKVLMEADPGYMARLLSLAEHEKKMLLDGDWEVYEGQGFPEFDLKIHVIEPFEIPSYWRRWRSADNGHTDPFAWYWFAVSPDGQVFIYREFTRDEKDPKIVYSDQARRVKELSTRKIIRDGEVIDEVEKIDFTVVGHDAFAVHHRDNKSLIDYYEEGGLSGFTKAETDRRLRKATWHEYLKPYQDHTEAWTAKVQIFNTCTKLIETLPVLPVDEKDPEKIADGNDHWYDGAGYGLIAYHIEKSKIPRESKGPIDEHKSGLAKKSIQRVRKRLT